MKVAMLFTGSGPIVILTSHDSVTDPILLYIGCYQVPMFLTPLLLSWLYRPEVKS